MQKRDNAYNNNNKNADPQRESGEHRETLYLCVAWRVSTRSTYSLKHTLTHTHTHIFVHLRLFHLSHSLLSTAHLCFFYCTCLHHRYVHVRANEFVSNNSFQKQNHSRKVKFTMIYILRRRVFCSVLTLCSNEGVLSLLVLHLSVKLSSWPLSIDLELFIELQLLSLLSSTQSKILSSFCIGFLASFLDF